RGGGGALADVAALERVEERGDEAAVGPGPDDPPEAGRGIRVHALGPAEGRADDLQVDGEDLRRVHVAVEREGGREPRAEVLVAQGLPERGDELLDVRLEADQRP